MRRMVEKILNCYGQEIMVRRVGVSVFGFLQPVRGKGENMVLKEVGPLGAGKPGQFVFIGPVEPELVMGDVLEADVRTFVVRRAERVCGTGGPAYQWGICVQKGGADT